MSLSKPRTWNGPRKTGAQVPYRRVPTMVKRTLLMDDVVALLQQCNKILTKSKKYRVKLLIDDREHGPEVEMLLATLDPSLVSRVHALAGDFILILNNKMFRVIERKRMDDLCSSIKDGRIGKQKTSMALLFRDVRMNPAKRFHLIVLLEKMSHDKAGCVDLNPTRAETEAAAVAAPHKQARGLNGEAMAVERSPDPLVAAVHAAENAEAVVEGAGEVEDESVNVPVNPSDDLYWLYGEPETVFENQSLNRQAIMGSLVNKMTRDGMSTFITEDANYTIMFLLKMMLAMEKNGPECLAQIEGQEDFDVAQLNQEHLELTPEQQVQFLDSRQLVKARPHTQTLETARLSQSSQQFVLQLMQHNLMVIEGAVELVRRHPTPHDWAAYLNAHVGNPQAVVDDIGEMPVVVANKAAKIFGRALALHLFNAFFGSEELWILKGKKVRARTAVVAGGE